MGDTAAGLLAESRRTEDFHSWSPGRTEKNRRLPQLVSWENREDTAAGLLAESRRTEGFDSWSPGRIEKTPQQITISFSRFLGLRTMLFDGCCAFGHRGLQTLPNANAPR